MRSLPTAAALLPRSAFLRSRSLASREALSSTRPNLLRETVLIAALFMVYRFGRAMIAGHVHAAMINATGVWEMERYLRFPNELLFQQWALRWPDMIQAANWYYVGVHFPLTAIFLAWGWWKRPPSDYRWARRLITTMTGLALVIHTVMPLAPPRMMSRLGFVDTMATIGPSAYSGGAATVANQFAAMPSLHVGWALLLAVVVIRTTTTRWRWLTLAHPAITTLVVVVTANHYWLDALVAAVLLAMTLAINPQPSVQTSLDDDVPVVPHPRLSAGETPVTA